MGSHLPFTRRELLTGAAALTALPAMQSVTGPAFAAAPQLAIERPSIYRAKLGQFQVTTILDGAIQADGPHPNFGENQPVEAVKAWATENFQSQQGLLLG